MRDTGSGELLELLQFYVKVSYLVITWQFLKKKYVNSHHDIAEMLQRMAVNNKIIVDEKTALYSNFHRELCWTMSNVGPSWLYYRHTNENFVRGYTMIKKKICKFTPWYSRNVAEDGSKYQCINQYFQKLKVGLKGHPPLLEGESIRYLHFFCYYPELRKIKFNNIHVYF
jgi:hypothetical protein